MAQQGVIVLQDAESAVFVPNDKAVARVRDDFIAIVQDRSDCHGTKADKQGLFEVRKAIITTPRGGAGGCSAGRRCLEVLVGRARSVFSDSFFFDFNAFSDFAVSRIFRCRSAYSCFFNFDDAFFDFLNDFRVFDDFDFS